MVGGDSGGRGLGLVPTLVARGSRGVVDVVGGVGACCVCFGGLAVADANCVCSDGLVIVDAGCGLVVHMNELHHSPHDPHHITILNDTYLYIAHAYHSTPTRQTPPFE